MSHIRRMGYLLTVLIGAALATAMVWKPAPPSHFVGVTSQDVPRVLDGYQAPSLDDPIPSEIKAALSSASMLSRTYSRSDDALNFLLIGGTDRTALHDPRSCLIGAGMRLEDDRLERLPGTSIDAHVCHAVGAPGTAGYDILYLYVVNGKVITQATQIRASMLLSALLGQRGTPVYFLRFTRLLASDPGADQKGHDDLQKFAATMWTTLQPKLVPATGI